jgi:hypothetical protein
MVHTGDGHGEVDATENHRGLERVIQTGCGEDSRAVVEEEVGTSQLLKRLHADTEKCTVHHARAGEDLVPGVFSTTGVLGIQLGFDLADFTVNFPVVLGHAVGLCDGGSRALNLSLAVLPTGRLAEEHDADRHYDRPDETDAHGDSPGRWVCVAFGSVVDAVGDEDTESNEELVAGYHASADLTGRGLRLVHRGENWKCSDAETCNPTAKSDLIPFRQGSHLNDHTNAEHDVPEDDGELPAEGVCDGCTNDGANEGTDGQQTNNGTRADLWECRSASVGISRVTESQEEIIHFEESRDLTRVITEDETTKRHDHDHGEDARSE